MKPDAPDPSDGLNSRRAGVTRRHALQQMVAAGTVVSLSGCAGVGVPDAAAGNPIQRENRQPGTLEWMLTKTRIDAGAKYRCPWIEGYCSHTSARAGDTISFHVSTHPASAFRIEIFRTGYYGGLRVKGLLSVGHDEYWSIEMYRHVQAAVAAGVNVGFFSGNAVCGRIQLTPDARGRRNRAFERIGVFGPPGGTHEFQAMSSLRHERPYANELVGAHSTGPVTGGADWVCDRPEHWIFAGTGMKKGDGIPGLVGWEWHGDPAPIPGLEVVATAPTVSAPGKPNGGVFTATVYPGPRGNVVFNAGTCWWADGLSAPPGYVRPSVYTSPQGPDERARRITANILERFRKS